jgi:hypothetical protein
LSDEGDAIDEVPVASDELSVQTITHVNILGRMDRTFPTSGALESDNLPMDTLPLEDVHIFVKVQDASTDMPEDTDVSTPSDEIFQIDSSYDEDQWDSAMDETVIYGEGIVSPFTSFVLHAF